MTTIKDLKEFYGTLFPQNKIIISINAEQHLNKLESLTNDGVSPQRIASIGNDDGKIVTIILNNEGDSI